MSLVECRKAWVREQVARAGAVPPFGSPEWCSLPDGIDKWVSVLRFAEGSLSALEDELTLYRPGHRGLYAEAKSAEDFGYVDRRDEHRRRWDVSWKPHPSAIRGEARRQDVA